MQACTRETSSTSSREPKVPMDWRSKLLGFSTSAGPPEAVELASRAREFGARAGRTEDVPGRRRLEEDAIRGRQQRARRETLRSEAMPARGRRRRE